MSWIFFALLAPLFWAASNYVDKYSLERKVRGIWDFLFFSTITGWIFVPVLVLYFGFPNISQIALVPIGLGALLIYSYGFYAKALQEGETSKLVVLFKMIPVFTLVLGFLFLGQTITSLDLLAFLLVLIGAVIISVDKTSSGMSVTKGIGWILIAILMWTLIFLVSDNVLDKMPFSDFVVFDALGSALAGLPLLFFPGVRREILSGLRGANFSKYSWFTLNNFLDLVGQILGKKALSLASSAGLVSVVMQAQSFYSIAMGLVLTLIFPNIFKEDTSKEAVGKKIFGAVIMFIGVYLLI